MLGPCLDSRQRRREWFGRTVSTWRHRLLDGAVVVFDWTRHFDDVEDWKGRHHYRSGR
jgi:hypothetical protein